MENLKDKPWHQLPAEEVVQFLGVNSSTGLSADEVRHRQKEFGPNRVTARLALGRQPWLPKKILQRELPARFMARLLGTASRIVRWLEVLLRPRLDFLHEQWIYRRVAGTLIMLSGLLLLLPIPLTNQLPGPYGGSAGRRGDGAGRSLFSGWLRRIRGDAGLLRFARLWRCPPPRQPAAHGNWIMKLEPQTQLGVVMEDPCLVHAAATELAKNHSVEAISIKAGEGKISVATIGCVSDTGVAERIHMRPDSPLDSAEAEFWQRGILPACSRTPLNSISRTLT